MWYYTSWDYDCTLSRQLTRDEYVEFVKLVEPMTCGWHIDTVGTSDLLKAYEDSFKSYDLRTELNTIVQFFVSKGIECHGEFTWNGEESGDEWKIVFKGRMFSEESPQYADDFLSKAVGLLKNNWYSDAAKFLEEYFD